MIRPFNGKKPTIADSAYVDETACIIGAASLVTDYQKIPNHSLVLGVPGQIKGRPSDKQLWWVTEAYKDYEGIIKCCKKENQ